MNEPQATQFGRAALQSGLVTEAELGACWQRIPEEKRVPDAIDRRLARVVVERGLLTKWQAQNLLGGLRPQGLWFDKYVLLDVLGQGGMGRVYLARDSRLNRRVALKVLSRERMNNPRAIARFRREAKVGAQLQHENLVRVYDEGEVGGTCYLVMEFIDGKTVGQLLGQRGPLPAPIAVRIARQVADGLEHAARKRLVHRDVNPMNILIDRDGTAKLTDLGLAIDLTDQGTAVTRDGATVGTFDYISPEQARHSHAIDTRSDMYSLGCTLYHMMAGRVPFPQSSLPEKLYAHQSLAAAPIETVVPGLPPGLPSILRKMMAKRAEDRYATPGELARALAPFEAGPTTLTEIEQAPEVPIWVDPSNLTEPGSDPSSGATDGGGTTAATGSKPGTDTFGPLPEINTEPSATLSTPAAVARRWPPVIAPEARRRLAVLGAVLGLLAVIWLVFRVGTSADPATPSPVAAVPTPQPEPPQATVPRSPIVVRWLEDDTEAAQPTLSDAVRLASGKNAEVILDGSAPVELSSAKPLIISGRVVLRAAAGTRPVLTFILPNPTHGILVQFGGSLTLIGLTLRCNQPPAHPTAVLVRSAGHLRMERCAVEADGSPRLLTAIRAEGRRSTFEACEFRGFDTTLDLGAFANTQTTISGCLFVRRPNKPGAEAWAVRLSDFRARNDRGPRRLKIGRTTTLGAGLLTIADATPASPLDVVIHHTVVEGPALLGWSGTSAFPSGLNWSGQENRYAIGGRPWVIVAGSSAAGAAPLPGDLATWSQAVGTESGTTVGDPTVPLGSADDLETRPLAALARAPEGLGFDPARLGPGGD